MSDSSIDSHDSEYLLEDPYEDPSEESILHLDMYLIFCSIHLVSSMLSVLSFIRNIVKKSDTADDKNQFLKELFHVQELQKNVMIMLMNDSVSDNETGSTHDTKFIDVYEHSEEYTRLALFRRSNFIKLVFSSALFDPNKNHSPHDLFGWIIVSVNSQILKQARSLLGSKTFLRIRMWFFFISELQKYPLFGQFSEVVKKKLKNNGISFEKLSSKRIQKNNEFPHFCPAALLVGVAHTVKIHNSTLLINMVKNNKPFHKFLVQTTDWESKSGHFISQTLGYSDFFENGLKDEPSIRVPYIEHLPAELSISTKPTDHFQHVAQRFKDFSLSRTPDLVLNNNPYDSHVRDSLIDFVNVRIDYKKFNDSCSNRAKQYRAERRKRQKNVELGINRKDPVNGEVVVKSHWTEVFDCLVHLMGDRVSKLLPDRNCRRSTGGFKPTSFTDVWAKHD